MEERRITPEKITQLKDDEVFVYGANLKGAHGLGAAKLALEKFGAVYGKGIGFQGQSYGIPTKDLNIKTLSIEEIKEYVDEFIDFARNNKDKKFFVTEIGCGLAGYNPKDIAGLFSGTLDMKNVFLPERFLNEII